MECHNHEGKSIYKKKKHYRISNKHSFSINILSIDIKSLFFYYITIQLFIKKREFDMHLWLGKGKLFCLKFFKGLGCLF